MAKIKVHDVSRTEKNKIARDFFDIVANLKTNKDAYNFLNGLLTESEVLMLARRVQVARMILAGASYEQIRSDLRISYYNISRIERWMKKDEQKSNFIKKELWKLEKKKVGKKQNSGGSLLSKYQHHKLTSGIFS